MEKFVEQCITLSKAMNWHFWLKDKSLTLEEVFSPMGLLPGIARRADQMALLCIGSSIGAEITEHKESTLGKKVTFPDEEISPQGMLFILDQILELGKTSDGETISLDDLLYD